MQMENKTLTCFEEFVYSVFTYIFNTTKLWILDQDAQSLEV
jgi:hypothetical protein